MLTSTIAPAPAATAAAPAPVRPSYRPFAVSVAGIRRLSDTFTRVTFTGPDLHDFGTVGLDQRVKVILPLPEVGISPLPDDESWYQAWRLLPDTHRNPIRTYTVRAVRPAAREIDIDFVAHGEAGPASRWVTHAAIGDELTIVGPNALGENPHSGVEWRPGDARSVLLAGDETAAPAICAILAALPRDARGCAFIEVPHEADAMDTAAPDGVQVTWLARAKAAGQHGTALEAAVRDWTTRSVSMAETGPALPVGRLADVDIEHDILWEVPEETHRGADLYAWLAGEAGVIKTLRRFLVSETGIDRRQVAFMGYWRAGHAEAN
ncbi:siderophore-interacting protein [Glaciibacter sp. 2TAF33]|uniref:siderophore-interacting protein n=1 Tax=Glaciibacter sp. 2TAF33 TaxID=3233015 RepID=UPI003F9016DD